MYLLSSSIVGSPNCTTFSALLLPHKRSPVPHRLVPWKTSEAMSFVLLDCYPNPLEFTGFLKCSHVAWIWVFLAQYKKHAKGSSKCSTVSSEPSAMHSASMFRQRQPLVPSLYTLYNTPNPDFQRCQQHNQPIHELVSWSSSEEISLYRRIACWIWLLIFLNIPSHWKV